MVDNMLQGIEVRLGEDYLQQKDEYDSIADRVIYTGAIDAYLILLLVIWNTVPYGLIQKFG